jgi:hypothetical protein
MEIRRRLGRLGLPLRLGFAPEQAPDASHDPGHRCREDTGLALDDVS